MQLHSPPGPVSAEDPREEKRQLTNDKKRNPYEYIHCEFCDKKILRSEKDKHELTHDIEAYKWNCGISECPRKFATRQGLYKHKKSKRGSHGTNLNLELKGRK